MRLIESAYRGPESRRGWSTEADPLDRRRIDYAEIDQILSASDSQMVLAEADGDLLGCCQVRAVTDDQAYMGCSRSDRGCRVAEPYAPWSQRPERIAARRWRASQMHIRVIAQREDLIAEFVALAKELDQP